MMLSNVTLRSRIADRDRWEPWQRITVDPLAPNAVQPCSIDVHLGDRMKVYCGPLIDTQRDNSPWWRDLPPIVPEPPDDPATPVAWILQPDHLYLAVLQEKIAVPEDCVGQLGGISSRARDGFVPHQQAGLLDPGWYGFATLEITVAVRHTVVYPGMRCGQVTFTLLDQRANPAYTGRYQGDREPQPARIHLPGRAA